MKFHRTSRSGFAFVLFVCATLQPVFACTADANDRGPIFACKKENDLYRAYGATIGRPAVRYATAAEAVEKAPPGSGVLILADEYPAKQTPVDAALFARAAEKKLRLFVEYPSYLPETE